MSSVESIAAPPSSGAGARSCTFQSPDLHQILRAIARIHRRGAIKWLERVTKKSPRMCKYWLAGRYLPKGSDALAIVRAFRAELDALSGELAQFELDLR